MATSSRLSLPCLESRAGRKGINLVGTGDCTHPKWLKELMSQLDETEEGFFTLKKEGRRDDGTETPRFVFSGEVATIYKSGGVLRKIHHLVIFPGFRAAASFSKKLEEAGGNILSDGRPILGMDSYKLLAKLLESDERAMLIPAHIWTPWFSVLGAKSGFNSIEECYRDLTGHIPAVETGLSSDPPMNWALSGLDRFSIISNSDAHSPEKLGREATILDIDLSYTSLRKALFSAAETKGPTVLGTIEFFPQEGKYHIDGHRKCGFSIFRQSSQHPDRPNQTCPVCGKPLTRGVMGRVLEPADRPVNESANHKTGSNRRPYFLVIPLNELLAELLGSGTTSKKVKTTYNNLIEKGGTEFSILMDMGKRDLEKLDTKGLPGEILAAAVMKMRNRDVHIEAGYDGLYGKISIFGPKDDKEV